MAAAPGDLTTVANVESYGSVQSATATDATIQAMITAASAMFYKLTTLPKTVFAATGYTEKYNGNNNHMLMLRQQPIISVESLSINGVVVPPSPDNIVAGYTFDDLVVYLVGCQYRFWVGVQNVAVGYHAGLAAVPADVEWAIRDLVLLWYRQVKNKGEKSVTINGATAAHDLSLMPPLAQTLIDQYSPKFPDMS